MDIQGYVIMIVETKDKEIKLYGKSLGLLLGSSPLYTHDNIYPLNLPSKFVAEDIFIYC